MIYVKNKEKIMKFEESLAGVRQIIELFPMVKYISLHSGSLNDCIDGIIEYLSSHHMECFVGPDGIDKDHTEEDIPEVSSIALLNGNRILIGQRSDTGKYTLPGGHLNPGESPINGAYRELSEETGIISKKLKHLGSKQIVCEDGKTRVIHAFTGLHSGKIADSSGDPDNEIKKWIWIDVSNGLPDFVKNNLHSKKNVVFEFLGLLNNSDTLRKSEKLKKDILSGGKGDGTKDSDFNKKELAMGKKVESEHTSNPKIAKEVVHDHLSENPKYYSKLKDAGLADELEKAFWKNGAHYPERSDPDGMPHPSKSGYIKITAKNNNPVWSLSPEVAKGHENEYFHSKKTFLDNQKISTSGLALLHSLAQEIESDPDRHVLGSGTTVNPPKNHKELRLRHLRGIFDGRENYKINENSEGLEIHAPRHSGNGDQINGIDVWNYSKKGLKFLRTNPISNEKGDERGKINQRATRDLRSEPRLGSRDGISNNSLPNDGSIAQEHEPKRRTSQKIAPGIRKRGFEKG